MIRAAALAGLVVLLAACASDPSLPPAPLDPCPLSASAPLETPPAAPVLTPVQQLAVDVGLIGALGPDLAAAYVQYHEVDYPAYSRRQVARVTGSIGWCASR